MLLVLIPLLWLAASILFVAICRTAASGDEALTTTAEGREHSLSSDCDSPSPTLQPHEYEYVRSAARRRWRAAHGLR
jgi:hypothetical protein